MPVLCYSSISNSSSTASTPTQPAGLELLAQVRPCSRHFQVRNFQARSSSHNASGEPAWAAQALSLAKFGLVAIAAISSIAPQRLTAPLLLAPAGLSLHKTMQLGGILLLVPGMMCQALQVRLTKAAHI